MNFKGLKKLWRRELPHRLTIIRKQQVRLLVDALHDRRLLSVAPQLPVIAYDFRFTPSGGALASYFSGKDIGVAVNSSENSTFTGSFESNFHGGAKGNIGTLEPLPVSISGQKFQDNNADGIKDGADAGLQG